MSILDRIDDTLDDWHGSNDAMRWKPEAERYSGAGLASREEVAAQAHAALAQMGAQLAPVFRRFSEQVNEAFASMRPLIAAMQAPIPEPRASALDARYQQRQRNRRRNRR